MRLFSIKNKVVLITGKSRGIGKKIAETFLDQGSIVIGLSRSKKNIIKDKNYYHFNCDVKNRKKLGETVTKAFKIKNKIDVLINNAGITSPREKNLSKYLKKFDETIDINLVAPYQISQLIVEIFKKNKNGGTIINISSIVGELGFPDNPAYIASKSALLGLTRSFARDYGKYNINVNAVLPGWFITDLNKKSFDDPKKRKIRSNLSMLNRWGKLSELVGTVVFLASNEAKFITGQKIIVDGGVSTKGI